jgi:hypothetical protein
MMSGIAAHATAATAVGSSLGAAYFGGLPLRNAVLTDDPAAVVRLAFKLGDVSIAAAPNPVPTHVSIGYATLASHRT